MIFLYSVVHNNDDHDDKTEGKNTAGIVPLVLCILNCSSILCYHYYNTLLAAFSGRHLESLRKYSKSLLFTNLGKFGGPKQTFL